MELLTRHRLSHERETGDSGTASRYCPICEMYFTNSLFGPHVRNHNLSVTDPATCPLCGIVFRRLGYYVRHIQSCHPDSKQNMQFNLARRMIPRFTCKICEKHFPSEQILNKHQLYHSEKSLLCSQCPKEFFSKKALDTHEEAFHSTEGQYFCEFCGHSFLNAQRLKTHILVHTGVRPFKCQHCEQGFKQYPHLQAHLRLHRGEKPYSCSHCGKSFAQNGNLKAHVRLHTGEMPYECPKCEKKFYDGSSKNKHWRKCKGKERVYEAVEEDEELVERIKEEAEGVVCKIESLLE